MRPKSPKLATKRQLRRYLKENGRRQHKCSDSSRCVLADFYVDTGVAPKVNVGGRYTRFYSEGGMLIAEKRNKPWQVTLIQAFDRLRNGRISGRVASTTVLSDPQCAAALAGVED